MKFKLKAPYIPAGDQPKAIEQLVAGLKSKDRFQTLLGVTGSGKTFTMANVIQQTQRPALVLAHNKTLAAQLCNEFREFFPENAVEYFVSYYDYYQPEAYLPRTDTYIEKEAMINDEIDRLRHAATSAILSRRDTIIVASVSCIYGLGSPTEYKKEVLHLKVGDPSTGSGQGSNREETMSRLVDMQFERTTADLKRGSYRVRGDVMEVMPMNEEIIYRISFEGDTASRIDELDPVTRSHKASRQDEWLFPAKHYVVPERTKERALTDMRRELDERLKELEAEGKPLEAERLKRRTRYDIEMIQNVGYCNGIENYSRHFDGRKAGEPPYTLLDYFPEDFLLFVDESHVTVPQVGGMYNGDQARKNTLIDHGFRLPSARDNRPLKWQEFEKKIGQAVFVSATPGLFEHKVSAQTVEQIIRPTGLVDPAVEVRPVSGKGGKDGKGGKGQVEDLIGEIVARAAKNERTLVTTLTKKMAEDLTEFLKEKDIKVQYLHSDVSTLDRITVLTDFRKGTYDVLVGVNLLREGLDLPEVTLVAILDADKEGFLRSETSLIQTIGRAARNVDGKVILYADQMTGSLKSAIRETDRRRKIQLAHNAEHGITPKTIQKKIKDIRAMLGADPDATVEKILDIEMVAEPHEIEAVIKEKEKQMKVAAKELDFETAAILRDEIVYLMRELKGKKASGGQGLRKS
ncbi:excinuclease ABC subunit UvrB [Patescibacteria group bacterium]|nr:MAG: excinuclease ABC subunit UvrB [Patescibacteria group bacterium]